MSRVNTTPAQRIRIFEQLRAGLTVQAISAETGVTANAIRQIAKRAGIPYPGQKSTGIRRPKPVRVERMTIVGENYRAAASHARWGYSLGGGWR